MNIKLPLPPKNDPKPPQNIKFRYFGELKDCDSNYQRRYDNHQKVKEMQKVQKKQPFRIINQQEKEIMKIIIELRENKNIDLMNINLNNPQESNNRDSK
jgi:hypothetical protein